MTQIKAQPFIKWAGGKRQLLPQYLQYFPKQYSDYYEPFLGGSAVFFSLPPHRSYLSDINSHLINTYQEVRDNVDDLIEALTEHTLKHSLEHYYQVRSNPNGTPLERAARFIYLNKTCFNGLYRENSKGEFNVPIGSYKNPAICQSEILRAASFRLQKVGLAVKSFDTVLNYATDEDFVYFDPPYHPISATSNFTKYSKSSFNVQDQEALRDVFAQLARHGTYVMLSNSDTQFVRSLYQGFHIHTVEAARSINSKASKRGKINEIVITNY